MFQALVLAAGSQYQLVRVPVDQEHLHVVITKCLPDHLDHPGQQDVDVEDRGDLAAYLGAGLQLQSPLLQRSVRPL